MKNWLKLALLATIVVSLLSGITGCAGSTGNEENGSTGVTTEATEEDGSTVENNPEETGSTSPDLSYVIVDTGQTVFYDNAREISPPNEGSAFYGQDAQYEGNQPSYRDNGNGTITDLNTGLMWQQYPGEKMTYTEAVAGAGSFSLVGYDDWRLPTIKELYSLIDFNGTDPDPMSSGPAKPFIDTDYFDFEYGDIDSGERIIDSQFASSTRYVSTTMNGNETMFGVNFADGRIKGYPISLPGQPEGKTFFVLYVRGNTDYGMNRLIDNDDGTVSDEATGLMWSQNDSGKGMDWETALAWVEQMNEEGYLDYSDWRMPNAKELQSIVDYSRSPDTTGSAAIDPVFQATPITNEAGNTDYGFYWTGTTHVRASSAGDNAVYLSFGRGLGSMDGSTIIDVHGAGCQRSDPKSGSPDDYANRQAPQGDIIRIDNFVRLVRAID